MGENPSGDLLGALENQFQTFESFQKELMQAGLTRFGSGWAWLAVHKQKDTLEIFSKPNQDQPDIAEFVPLLGFDVWEHAYYLKYQNRRPEYLEALWSVVDWDCIARRYDARKEATNYA